MATISDTKRTFSGRRGVWLTAGCLFLLLGLADLGYELFRFAESGSYRMISAAELWFTVDVPSLNLTQSVVQRFIHPYLWQPLLTGLLSWPLWSLFGAPGALLVIVFSHPLDSATAPGRA